MTLGLPESCRMLKKSVYRRTHTNHQNVQHVHYEIRINYYYYYYHVPVRFQILTEEDAKSQSTNKIIICGDQTYGWVEFWLQNFTKSIRMSQGKIEGEECLARVKLKKKCDRRRFLM